MFNCSSTNCWKGSFLLHSIAFALLWKIIFVWVYFQILCSVLSIYVSVLPILYSLDYCSYTICFKMGQANSFHFILFFFLTVVLNILISLPFHIHFRTISFYKKASLTLQGGSMASLPVVCLVLKYRVPTWLSLVLPWWGVLGHLIVAL